MSRDWAAVRQSKDAYWGERIATLGPAEGCRIAEELRRQAIALNPDWPDAALRGEDLRAHARLADLFRRASSASRR